MKRRMKKSRRVAMDGKSKEPFMKRAKKPEPDDKPHMPVGAPSVNSRSHSKREKRLKGVML